MTDSLNDEFSSLPYWQGVIEHVRAGTFDRKAARANVIQANKAFEARMEDADYWNGVTRPLLGSPLYKDIKDALEFAVDIKPMPWSSAFQSWVVNDRHFDALITATHANPQDFNYDRFRGDFFELFGRAMADGPDGRRLTSPEYDKDDPTNVRYVSMLADGSYAHLSNAEVTRLLRDPKGPHVIVSASHAFLESLDEDVKPLFDAYGYLYAHTNGTEGKILATLDKESLGANDTVMIAALHTRENKYLNLAQLFHRVGEIEALGGNSVQDKFLHSAPIALETTAMILRSIVAENDIGVIQPRRDAFGSPQFLAEGATVHVTAEGLENLKRRIGEGFSKGGNDMRDAMRLLRHVLDDPRVILPPDVALRDVMSQIALSVTALNEMRMTDHYRDYGVRVTHISNGNDTIAPPQRRFYEHNDPALNYLGAEKWGGHAPSIAAEGIAQDPRASAHFKTSFAGTHGQAALCGMHLVDGETGIDPNPLRLEVSPGTTDAAMREAFGRWQEKCAARGLASVELVQSKPFGTDRFLLCNGDGSPLATPESIGILRQALGESGIVQDLAVAEQLHTIKGALKISEKSGLALTATEPLKSADILVRIDNKLRRVPGTNPGDKPVTKVVIGAHPRIQRNVVSPTAPSTPSNSPARPHHDRLCPKHAGIEM